MLLYIKNKKVKLFYKAIVSILIIAFASSQFVFPSNSYAQNISLSLTATSLAQPSEMLIQPAMLKGIIVNPQKPFEFDFLLDKGDSSFQGDDLKAEADKLIRYFLASLTMPESDLWVNLNPKQPNRIVSDEFGSTQMGKDLLLQDYILKQITSSLMHPETEAGKKFWDKIYAQAKEQYGTTDIPTDALSRVWIVPEKAVVYENGDRAFVVEAKLKVLLEEEYLEDVIASSAKQSAAISEEDEIASSSSTPRNDATNIIKSVIIPELEREVNEGAHFAPLRQIYNSLILATWYKKKLKSSILNKNYSNRKKIEGLSDPVIARSASDVAISSDEIASQNTLAMMTPDKIYEKYLQAFKEGAFNQIKEEYDPKAQEIVPRKYFSGGLTLNVPLEITNDYAMISIKPDSLLNIKGIFSNTNVKNKKAFKEKYDDRTFPGRMISGDKNYEAFMRLGFKMNLFHYEGEEIIEDFYLERGGAKLIVEEKFIYDVKEYEGLFEAGDKVLDMHIDGIKPRNILYLLGQFFSAETIDAIKNAGYTGIVGDTNNQVFIERFSRYGFKTIGLTPEKQALLVKKNYDIAIKNKGYPEIEGDVFRIALNFNSVYEKHPNWFNRDYSNLDEIYNITKDLEERKDSKQKVLFVGVGFGVATVEMAIKYPNLEIQAVNKENELWNYRSEIYTNLKKKGYSSGEIAEAEKRIKVVILDIENEQQRSEKLSGKKFDLVLFGDNIFPYIKDKVKIIADIYNEFVSIDGIYAFCLCYTSINSGSTNSRGMAEMSDIVKESFSGTATLEQQFDKNIKHFFLYYMDIFSYLKFKRIDGRDVSVPLKLDDSAHDVAFSGDYKSILVSVYNKDKAYGFDNAMITEEQGYVQNNFRTKEFPLGIKNLLRLFSSERDKRTFEKLYASGRLSEAKSFLLSRANYYENFQFQSRKAIYPGGLDLKIFDMFPNLEEVHFINLMPFRVPFEIKDLKWMTLDERNFGNISGQEAFDIMKKLYIGYIEHARFIPSVLQSNILYSFVKPQIGMEPFIKINLEYRGYTEVDVVLVKNFPYKMYKISFLDNFKQPKTIYYHQVDINKISESDPNI
ncbi:MAG: hypothetical protein P9X22_07140, partial [Candidatus Zapsychrus exili]|nr:hypothetical protein [Candidatus Zapsychrus exili]